MELTRSQEEALIARALAGDTQAFGPLVERYQKPLLSFIHTLLRKPDRVEDIGQETFIKAFRALATHDPARAAFSTWLFAIARNGCIDELRRPSLVRSGLQGLEDAQAASYPPRDKEAVFIRLERALDALPREQRETFTLVCAQGLTLEEAAIVLGCPTGTVKSRLNRAREALRRTVLGQEAEAGGKNAKP